MEEPDSAIIHLDITRAYERGFEAGAASTTDVPPRPITCDHCLHPVWTESPSGELLCSWHYCYPGTDHPWPVIVGSTEESADGEVGEGGQK